MLHCIVITMSLWDAILFINIIFGFFFMLSFFIGKKEILSYAKMCINVM
jgi:uncharacterized protein YneF (UPF0154 family)